MKTITKGLLACLAVFLGTPSWGTAAEQVDADNTAVNVRDARNNTLTPIDQSTDRRDQALTQKIRQALVADGTLSVNAKNIKIITIGGKVTLRGPVESPAEIGRILSKANPLAGVSNIHSQLEAIDTK